MAVNPRNGDTLVGTGDIKNPGCKSGEWGWWEIDWAENGRDGHFDAMVDFMKTQYKVSLFHENDGWKLCMDD